MQCLVTKLLGIRPRKGRLGHTLADVRRKNCLLGTRASKTLVNKLIGSAETEEIFDGAGKTRLGSSLVGACTRILVAAVRGMKECECLYEVRLGIVI